MAFINSIPCSVKGEATIDLKCAICPTLLRIMDYLFTKRFFFVKKEEDSKDSVSEWHRCRFRSRKGLGGRKGVHYFMQQLHFFSATRDGLHYKPVREQSGAALYHLSELLNLPRVARAISGFGNRRVKLSPVYVAQSLRLWIVGPQEYAHGDTESKDRQRPSSRHPHLEGGSGLRHRPDMPHLVLPRMDIKELIRSNSHHKLVVVRDAIVLDIFSYICNRRNALAPSIASHRPHLDISGNSGYLCGPVCERTAGPCAWERSCAFTSYLAGLRRVLPQ